MRGRVRGNAREAAIPMRLRDRYGEFMEIEFVVDTGFTGALALPHALVDSLSLPFAGEAVAVLADGSAVEARVHRARIMWHGRMRTARVITTEGGPLVGMSFMRGGKLFIDVSPGGEVVVEEAGSSS